MSHYKAVLLDFYGTLVEEDSPFIHRIVGQIAEASSRDPAAIARDWSAIYRRMCVERRGPAFTTQRLIEVEGLQEMLDACQVDLDAGAMVAGVFEYWQSPTPYPDTATFLAHLPVPYCLVSNIDTDDVQAALSALSWPFEHVVTSEMSRAYKPHPEPFEAALRLLHLQPQEVLHVGDSATADVAGAQALGIDVAWLNRSNRPIPTPRPTFIAQSLTDVLRFVNGRYSGLQDITSQRARDT